MRKLNSWSLKYSSILSFSVDLLAGANKPPPSIFWQISHGFRMTCFSHALVIRHARLVERGCRHHVDNLPDVLVAPFDHGGDNLRGHLQSFPVADGHDPGSNLVYRGPDELHIPHDGIEWLHLLQLAVVADEDERNLCLLADLCEGNDAAAITRRHAVILVHDEDRVLLGHINLLSVASEESQQGGIVERIADAPLDEFLASGVAGIALDDIVPR